jgi:hypothetical protein
MANDDQPKPVDLDALARKYGGTAAPSVDFAALAKKHGGSVATEQAQETAPKSTLIKTSISARPKGVSTWLENLETDIRTGSATTLPGRILHKMGAKGLEYGVSKEAGEFIGSPILGTTHALQGAALIPSKPWEGTKKLVGGVMEAGTIPGLLAAGPEEGGAAAMGKLETLLREASAARKAGKSLEEWRKINKVLGVSSKAIRIGEGAKGIEDAATMPGRSLQQAGFTAKKLEKMKPIERMMAIRPHVEQAGKQIEAALQAHEKAGKTVDVGARVFETLKKIANPRIQEQAIEEFNNLAKELGIPNQRAATPTEAWKLRKALVAGARFGQGGDLNSLGTVRAALYGSVSSDLKAAVPELQKLDPLFSDLKTAMNAATNGVRKEAVKGSKPSLLQRIGRGAKREVTDRPLRTIALGLGIPYAGHEIAKHYSDHVP